MNARRIKKDPGKTRCDRCQQDRPPITECVFSFPEGYRHWKRIWEERAGKRLTNRRKERLKNREEDQLDLRQLSDIRYWTDLCEACWEECHAAPCDGFPMDYWEDTLRSPRHSHSAEQLVPTKMEKSPPPPFQQGLAL